MEKASLDQDQAVEPPDQVIRCTRALNRAAARVADVIPAIRQLQAAGKTMPHTIAAGLNEAGIPTARGRGSWSAARVKRLLKQIEA